MVSCECNNSPSEEVECSKCENLYTFSDVYFQLWLKSVMSSQSTPLLREKDM